MAASDNSTPYTAEEYDKSVRQTIPFYETIQSEIVGLVVALKPRVSQWLDTGCGTGYMVDLASRSFPTAEFVLTDPSEAMLEVAKKRLKSRSGRSFRFLPAMPSQRLLERNKELKPQVITAILCHHYLNKERRRTATNACYDLLDADGVFITVENILPGSPRGITVGVERWKRFQVEQGKTLSQAEEHSKRLNTEFFPITVAEHLDLLRSSGFRTAELFWYSYMQAGFYAIK